MATAVVLICFATSMCGRLVDISNELKHMSGKIGERRLFLAKFAKSADTFYIQSVTRIWEETFVKLSNIIGGKTKLLSQNNMISKTAAWLIGLRVQIMKLSGLTILEWDSSSQQYVKPSKYWIYHAYNTNLGGLSVVIMYIVDIYLKLVNEEIAEEGQDTRNEADLRYFATFIIEIAEIMLTLCVVLLGFLSVAKSDDLLFSFNQIYACSNSFYDNMLQERSISLDAGHKNSKNVMEFLVAVLLILSITVPFCLAAAVFHPIEPTHQILDSWFEIEVTFNWKFFPFFIFSGIVLMTAGGTTSLLCTHILCYYILAITCLEDMKPLTIFKRNGPTRSILTTKFFGKMEDIEIVKIYRVQQLLNILLNDFYKSLLVSYHHVGVLAAEVVYICFAVRFVDIMLGGGIVACLVVFALVVMPFALIYVQTTMCGRLEDVSNEFKQMSSKIGGRRLLLAKFAESFDTFYIQVAYPFYDIDRKTFAQFFYQVVNYVITLLLW
ncbi:unnamed protein product [Orchesella dallaii]|uniref:Odorant receptor n=1 Tax=Orchesella dallaii TaxID=48710 RepID=A0ABP1S7J8_9HEXA